MPIIQAAYPYEEWDLSVLNAQVIQQAVVIAFVIAVTCSFWIKYTTKKKTKEVLTLSFAFTLLSVSLIAGTIPMVFALVDPSNIWIFGLPVWPGFQLEWINFAYIATTTASFLILWLTNMVFRRPHKIVIVVFAACIVAFDIWIFRAYGGISVWDFMDGIPMGVMFFGINFTPWCYLLVSSEDIRRKATRKSDKRLLSLFSLGALWMLLSFFMFGLRQILASSMDVHVFDVLYWTFFVLTGVFIFLGYATPEFFMKWLKKRYGESA